MQDLATWADDEALRLTQKICELDPLCGNSLIENHPYIDHLKCRSGPLDFSTPDEKLSQDDLRLRHSWVQLLKKHHPKKLAELI